MSLSTLGLARVVCSKIALRYAADADAACMMCLVEIGKDIITPVLTRHLLTSCSMHGMTSSVTPAFVDTGVRMEH